jgi:hypothetical protein
VTYFHGDEAKIIFFFLKKKFKMADSKKLSFSTSPKAEQFSPKFHRLVLGIVGLIDAKGINVTQPIDLQYNLARLSKGSLTLS